MEDFGKLWKPKIAFTDFLPLEITYPKTKEY